MTSLLLGLFEALFLYLLVFVGKRCGRRDSGRVVDLRRRQAQL